MYFLKSGIFVVGLSSELLKGDSTLGVRSNSPAVRSTMSALPRRCWAERARETHRRGRCAEARNSARDEVVRGAIVERSGGSVFAVSS